MYSNENHCVGCRPFLAVQQSDWRLNDSAVGKTICNCNLSYHFYCHFRGPSMVSWPLEKFPKLISGQKTYAKLGVKVLSDRIRHSRARCGTPLHGTAPQPSPLSRILRALRRRTHRDARMDAFQVFEDVVVAEPNSSSDSNCSFSCSSEYVGVNSIGPSQSAAVAYLLHAVLYGSRSFIELSCFVYTADVCLHAGGTH